MLLGMQLLTHVVAVICGVGWGVGVMLYEHPCEIDMAVAGCQMQRSRPVLPLG